MRRFGFLVALAVVVLPATAASGGSTNADWGRFGYDAARSSISPDTTITAANVSKLHRLRVQLDGTVDSSPIYVAKGVRGHDAFVVTTTYGRTEALDANTGKVLWRFTPPDYAHVAGTAQITNSAPALSTDRAAVYAAASDGRIRKLRLSDGHVLWTTAITRDPTHEKITSPLNVARGLVLATTGGYIGDIPPYQGHVVTLFEGNGRIDHVWNSLCANVRALMLPRTCGSSDSAIWSRNGAAVDPQNGDLVVATGNATFNGSTDWGDSVLVLSPDASKLLRHWTPANQAQLNSSDLDLGSTSPAFLSGGLAVQGGKDGLLRLLNLNKLPGVNAKTGGELQTVPVPGQTDMFSEPAIWKGRWVFLATGSGTAAWLLKGGRLHAVWSNATDGTSPVVAGNLLYVAGNGAVNVYVPTSGRKVASLPTGDVHWQSPIVAAGRVAMTEGNANSHTTSGVLDIFRAG
ncbi:MAG TPA: PQQ-binding-like beta-propeller repeat protein [Gaiellaceae bacterium]|jgi:outer membrane protein assembly factor BamB|nr:PQQ-binding-like beta-propeller repeat protein [Gaiellaceae bacterium]